MGNQAKSPSVMSSGSRNATLANPSRLNRIRATRRRTTRWVTGVAWSIELMVSVVCASWRGRVPDDAGTGGGSGAGIGRRRARRCRDPSSYRCSAGVDDGLDLGVGRIKQRVDVGILVGEDGLHDRVKSSVELLGVHGRLCH